MLSLFYRAWAQTQPVVQMDRPGSDRFRVWLGALAGAVPAAAQGSALPPALLAYHAGWLAGRSAHPEMLSKALGQVLGVAVWVEEHVGHWLAIEPQDRSRLGFARSRPERSAGSTMGAAAQLGLSANAGHQVWDRQYRFRLHIGPLDRATFDSLLPGGSAWEPLAQLVQLIAGRDKTWDLALVLREADRPPPRLQRTQRLGISSWLAPPRSRAAHEHRALHLRPLTSFLTRKTNPAPTGAAHA